MDKLNLDSTFSTYSQPRNIPYVQELGRFTYRNIILAIGAALCLVLLFVIIAVARHRDP